MDAWYPQQKYKQQTKSKHLKLVKSTTEHRYVIQTVTKTI